MGLIGLFVLLIIKMYGQSQNFSYTTHGPYAVPSVGEWTYRSELSQGRYFVFEKKDLGLEVGLIKEPQPCQDAQAFNRKIIHIIQELKTQNAFQESRKTSSPVAFMGQTSAHLLKIKSRDSGESSFLYHPVVQQNLYEIFVKERTPGTEPSVPVLEFLSLIYLSGDKENQMAALEASQRLQRLRPFEKYGVADSVSVGEKGIEQMKKVKTDGEISNPEVSAGEQSAGEGVTMVESEDDELEQVILPVGAKQQVHRNAELPLEVLKNPRLLLDAMEGGRPDGHVSAMIALLRQSTGPWTDSEEKQVYQQYAAHAQTSSPRAGKTIRQQSDLLLQALLRQQLALGAAWEYEMAQGSHKMAELMEDEDEMYINLLMAQIQEQVMEEQEQELMYVDQEMQQAEEIPTSEEILKEDRNEREQAFQAVAAVYGVDPSKLRPYSTQTVYDEDYAKVQRYFALREEHRMLQSSCQAGSEAACKEASDIYKEAMKLRKELEDKGIDVFNYQPKTVPGDNPVIGEEYLEPIPSRQDPTLSDEQNQAIAEHEYNIRAAQKSMAAFRAEWQSEQDPGRREELRLQVIHMAQNIHDSQDLIESIRTGSIVKTRGPWDEHSACVLAEMSARMREEHARAAHLQASYAKILAVLQKHDPVEARKWRDQMGENVIKGVFEPGGFLKAKNKLDQLHRITKGVTLEEQSRLYTDKERADAFAAMTDRHLRYLENLKSGCDKAIMVGTFFTGAGAGMILSMAYEGVTTSIEKNPKEALKNMAKQLAIMGAMRGGMALGKWGIGKLLNPKIPPSRINHWKDALEKARYDQEMAWNKGLVRNFKEKALAFEKAKAAGGKNYLQARMALDDAINAANSSTLSKRLLKNEILTLQNQIKSGVTRDYSSLREALRHQNLFDRRLQNHILPRVDQQMVNQLKRQGYNVEGKWFQEFRNASSFGYNMDRDLGLIPEAERLIRFNGKSVNHRKFLQDAQKAYNDAYHKVTGRSASLADQTVTTSGHNEAFPTTWLQNKMQELYPHLDDPREFQKAGGAIFNKVSNALKGSDPAFVKMKNAAASLSKDLKTKVIGRLQSPPSYSNLSPEASRKAAEHWSKVQKALEDFATDQSDPFTTMKKLQQLTGNSSISQSAAEVKKLMNALSGANP